MKKEKISKAMGNISTRHIEEAAEFKVEEKPPDSKKIWVKRTSFAASFFLIVATVFVIITMLNNDRNGGIHENVLPTNIENIIWKANNDLSDNDSSDNDSNNGYIEFNEFFIDTYLYDALQNSSDKYIAIVMTKSNGQKIKEQEYTEIVDKTIHRDYKNNNLYLFVTKDQFLNWKIENKSDYIFYLASMSDYEDVVTETFNNI